MNPQAETWLRERFVVLCAHLRVLADFAREQIELIGGGSGRLPRRQPENPALASVSEYRPILR
jgi:hypothetical protein